jgi:hypothetical protein
MSRTGRELLHSLTIARASGHYRASNAPYTIRMARGTTSAHREIRMAPGDRKTTLGSRSLCWLGPAISWPPRLRISRWPRRTRLHTRLRATLVRRHAEIKWRPDRFQ